ncbi:NAD(P)-dependent dehydrogenase, short-chain alcohol dehydrogenase family [Paenibacillus sp. yr247]|uniref:SDR family NAD(P)-dependent oxidoreductase n=1 Tax=Paenibacillus sp. yr247 TaxID=1761880 RepID=UPI000890EDA0|nr:SDR family oxidoreductase [Paenibacillus sp. yr247]SDN52761.1 NAD(P)-dependent dehydrogenase, short-chain alcohol dehydrogenase family [Paenibacillus sp. yr247]
MGKLDGKVAVVTGGNSGIGLATAQQLVQEGAYVYITGRNQSNLDDAVKQIGKNVTAVQADVSNFQDLDNLYGAVKSQHDHIDILFANAGVVEKAPIGEITEKMFDNSFNINVKGVLFTVQKALPLFRDGGSIILNSSTQGSSGALGSSIYGATKAAVRAFARNWLVDLKSRKIRVNVVSPGPIKTVGLAAAAGASEEVQKKRLEFLSSLVPQGRLGTPVEVAKAVVFLASDDSSFVNGIELFVDGGMKQV